MRKELGQTAELLMHVHELCQALSGQPQLFRGEFKRATIHGTKSWLEHTRIFKIIC